MKILVYIPFDTFELLNFCTTLRLFFVARLCAFNILLLELLFFSHFCFCFPIFRFTKRTLASVKVAMFHISKVLNVQWFSYDSIHFLEIDNYTYSMPMLWNEDVNAKTIKVVHEMNRKLMYVWMQWNTTIPPFRNIWQWYRLTWIQISKAIGDTTTDKMNTNKTGKRQSGNIEHRDRKQWVREVE